MKLFGSTILGGRMYMCGMCMRLCTHFAFQHEFE